jgi:hypothetical protein
MTTGTLVFTAIGLTGLWVSWFLLWKGYYLDKCRHELFALRGELFQAALSGEVEFNDPAYHMLRMLLNGMIRFNHRFNVTTLFLSAFNHAPEGHENLYTRWRLHVNRLAPESREHLNRIYMHAHMTIMAYMAEGSLLLRLVFLFYLLRSLFRRSESSNAVKNEMARDIKLDRLEREVYFSQEYECKLAAA